MDQGGAMLVREISTRIYNAAIQDAVVNQEHHDTV
jgi:hypothetical protein